MKVQDVYVLVLLQNDTSLTSYSYYQTNELFVSQHLDLLLGFVIYYMCHRELLNFTACIHFKICTLSLQQHHGNVHTGATPPWLRPDDDDSDVEEVCVYVLYLRSVHIHM